LPVASLAARRAITVAPAALEVRFRNLPVPSIGVFNIDALLRVD